MNMKQRVRRIIGVALLCLGVGVAVYHTQVSPPSSEQPKTQTVSNTSAPLASEVLSQLEIKGRAPKTGYTRQQFGSGWSKIGACDTRNIILNRDLKDVVVGEDCKVISGRLDDPYTGKIIEFKRGAGTSDDVQIDHVVALSNAWQTGAQSLTLAERTALANDPLELLAVDGSSNQTKGDGDAATWLPPNKLFRCQYVARQIAVKSKYKLWVTQAEHDAMRGILDTCPDQQVPVAAASN